MEESNADHVSIEINPDHNQCASTDSTIEVTYGNAAAIEINNNDHNGSASASSLPVVNDEAKHDHYRFAYDLVEKVLEIRGELNPAVPRNLPEPTNYLFTDEHAKIVANLLETKYRDTTSLLREIYQLTHGMYDYESYVKCRDFFADYWRANTYTEKAFICACASIAYTAAHFIQVNVHCGALDDAVKFIACMLSVILKGGTIAESCWGYFK